MKSLSKYWGAAPSLLCREGARSEASGGEFNSCNSCSIIRVCVIRLNLCNSCLLIRLIRV